MKKPITWLLNIWNQPDKLKHVIAGMVVALFADVLAGVLCPAWPWIWLIPIVTSALAGGLKELYDSTGCGTVDIGDFWATLLGGAIVWIAVIIKTFL